MLLNNYHNDKMYLIECIVFFKYFLNSQILFYLRLINLSIQIKIAFEEKSINCGGQIYLNDAYSLTQITSPLYPNIPPAHIECIWTIVAPSAKRISVIIEDLDFSVSEE